MTSSASTDTFPALPADVAEVRRAAGITIAPEAALHRAPQERTDELERVRRLLRETEAVCMRRVHDITEEARIAVSRTAKERDEARAIVDRCAQAIREHAPNLSVRGGESAPYELSTALQWLKTSLNEMEGERNAWRAMAREHTPTAPDVGSTISAPAAGAADPPRRRTPDEIRAWAAGLFGEVP